jgi:four helix bundle protein
LVIEKKKVQGYKDLLVWQKGIQLAKEIYRITQTFSNEERFGLVSQMRRGVVSIPSNIAEGQARHTTKEFVQFVSHAEGSVAEMDTQLILAWNWVFAQQRGPQTPRACLLSCGKC